MLSKTNSTESASGGCGLGSPPAEEGMAVPGKARDETGEARWSQGGDGATNEASEWRRSGGKLWRHHGRAANRRWGGAGRKRELAQSRMRQGELTETKRGVRGGRSPTNGDGEACGRRRRRRAIPATLLVQNSAWGMSSLAPGMLGDGGGTAVGSPGWRNAGEDATAERGASSFSREAY